MIILTQLKKQMYKDATNVFREFARQEEAEDNQQSTIKELVH